MDDVHPQTTAPTDVPRQPRTLPGADASALALGHVTDQRIRKSPKIPSWALKVTMAITGTIFVLFVFVHMVGNLKAFIGPEDYNHYALFFHTALYPLLPVDAMLWILRIVLSVSLVLHVGAAVTIARRARASRGSFRRKKLNLRSFGARNMLVSGFVILGFLVFHLLDLTAGKVVATDDYRHVTPDTSYAYENLIASMQRPWSAAIYAITLLILTVHLAHGIWTVVSDLGGTGRRLRKIGVIAAGLVALVVLVGNILLPIAITTGVLS